jgi:uncharacterized membrane protein YccC
MSSEAEFRQGRPAQRPVSIFDVGRLASALSAAGPPLLFGLRLWASVCLALYVAFWLQLDNASWAGTSAAVVCQPHLGASLRKGWYRMIGTVIGAVATVLLTACFPQDRAPFLLALALWGGGCAFVATLLRNFASYSAALAGFTAVIIASDQLGAVGGPNGDAFMLAVIRASEICIGIVCAGIVLAGTDFGNAQRRLAVSLAGLSAEIMSRFAGTLASAGSEFGATRTVRRELARRVIALDPVIDEAFGESSQLRYHSPVLQTAADGLFAALACWRSVAVVLRRLPEHQARQEVDAIVRCVPRELRSREEGIEQMHWLADPVRPRGLCEAAARSLIALPASTPTLRLLADQTAKALAGISHALNGLALLISDAARPVHRRRGVDLRVPDWLPPLVGGARAFVMIGAAALFWIITAWPNGASAITWVAIVVIVFAPQADRAYANAFRFMAGAGIAAIFAAIFAFAVLPQLRDFASLSLALGLYLVPAGALMAQPWQTAFFLAMAVNFVPLLAPANQMSYDTIQFYNASLALTAGICAAALSFRLLPPLSPGFRTRRLLALTLSDLRRLATAAIPRTPEAWKSRVYGRLSVLPDEASPLERAQLVTALSVGAEIIHLRRIGRRLGLGTDVDGALEALARGNSRVTNARLAQLDQTLALRPGRARAVLRVRSIILAISDAINEHADYFDAGGQR